MSEPFEARYHGACEGCLEAIKPGDLVKYTDDGELVHVRCEYR